ncbi:GDSL family lipase [Pseudomonas azotoformans]|uniref:GDSL family lipase n=1 Tax=Pseudomonas azotoformans TaxID=47878 RepID=A0A1V2JGT2_PSEAZ|nr:SGNH/GDSL hydrolase family protein [Pseudomonas azotoformans]OIN46112.1 GDSL family lipase [Pseudomonas azotoformans]ONH44568.1 GDSL family lipase [Pseudomonas azotoformans]SDN22935.1 Phospholipase/lecithinase/hemolysin [Pseudomonas azotoformans]
MIRRACLAALLTLSASTAFGASTYDHVYAFGDSYSDNGAGEALTTRLAAQKIKEAQVLPGPLYWQGRWSNGPTAVEGLAQALHTPLTDYAVGGAKSGHGNYYTWMMPSEDTGVLGQVAEHLHAAKSHNADPKALYFIFISANDFFEWADFSHTETLEALSESSLANIRKATEQLVAAGARHVMVVGTTDLSHVPAVVQGNQVANAKKYQQLLAQKLPALLAQIGTAKVSYFDHLAFSDALRANPAAHGFSDLDTPCQVTYPEAKPVCANPDAHYYWDEWHPTRKVHALAANAMLDALP